MGRSRTALVTDTALCAFATTLIFSSMIVGGTSTHPPTCEKYYFYDHGLKACQHCRDLCFKAEYKGTTEQCLDQCKAYAEILWPPDPPTEQPSGPQPDTDSGFPLGAAITIPCAVLLLIFIVVYIHHRIKKFRPSSSSTAEEFIPLQQVTSQSPERSREEERESASEEREPTPSSGIQEEGKPDFDAPGAHSCNILPRTVDGEITEDIQRYSPMELRSPIPVTDDGHTANGEMVLLDPRPLLTVDCDPAGLADLLVSRDNTEPKSRRSGFLPAESSV